jgi:hypothetical protein
MLKIFRKKLGEIIKIVFGRNSATSRMTNVEMIVLNMRTKRSDPKRGVRKGPRSFEKKRP